jgi:hypothetical protein
VAARRRVVDGGGPTRVILPWAQTQRGVGPALRHVPAGRHISLRLPKRAGKRAQPAASPAALLHVCLGADRRIVLVLLVTRTGRPSPARADPPAPRAIVRVMDGPSAFAHPAAFSWATQQAQAQAQAEHYANTDTAPSATASYPQASYWTADGAWYAARPVPDTTVYDVNAAPSGYSPGGRYHLPRRFHPYMATESSLSHALQPISHVRPLFMRVSSYPDFSPAVSSPILLSLCPHHSSRVYPSYRLR